MNSGMEVMISPYQKIYLMTDGLGSVTENHGGFSFHFTLVETSPALRSTMRTSLPLSLNATIVECRPNTLGTGFTSDTSIFSFLGSYSIILFYFCTCDDISRVMQFPIDLEG